jgi:alkanesulfonate monooxygenase SsuD/methylene tetrahydromethanopterin reductase-like flavin-dependent oxidoreductase (luciferase family)
MPVEFGFSLPAGPTSNRIKEWLDDIDTQLTLLGDYFTSLWMTDHFFWEDTPTHEAWTVLAYAAARWPRYTVGPMVLGQGYRNPALLAKMGATLQHLSQGRLVMAVGAGWKEDEHRAYGYEYPSAKVRVEQLEDTLEILKRMWTEPGKVTYTGKHYSIQDAYCEPKPDPVPPIIVGGGGRTTMLLAVRYADMWNMPDAPWNSYKARLDTIAEHCDTVGRDPATLRLSWFGRLAVARTESEALALSDGKWTPNNAFVGSPQQVIDQMRPFIEAGVDYFMVEPLGLDNPDIVGMLKEDVLPELQQMGGA